MREKLHSVVVLWILCSFYIFLSCCHVVFSEVLTFFFLNLDLNPASGVTWSKFVKWGGIS